MDFARCVTVQHLCLVDDTPGGDALADHHGLDNVASEMATPGDGVPHDVDSATDGRGCHEIWNGVETRDGLLEIDLERCHCFGVLVDPSKNICEFEVNSSVHSETVEHLLLKSHPK